MSFQTKCGLKGRIEPFDEYSTLIYFVDHNGQHMDIPSGITYHNPFYQRPLPIPKYYIIILCDGEYTIKRYGKTILTYTMK